MPAEKHEWKATPRILERTQKRFLTESEEVAQLVHEIRAFLASGRSEGLQEFLSQFHPADIATAINLLHPLEKERVFALLTTPQKAEVLDEVDAETESHLVESTEVEQLSDILEELPPDEAADIIGEMDDKRAEQVLDLMGDEESREIQTLLQYPEDSAGGIMSTEFVSVREDMTAEEALEAIRQQARPESIFYVYVVDQRNVLKGVLDLRRLITAAPDTPVRDIMTHGVVFVFPEQDQEEVARLVAHYDLLAIPVVDHDYHLIGVITVDDIIDVIEEELTEDIFRLAGSDAEELERRSPFQIARMRLPWLAMTLGVELLAAMVIHAFDETLSQLILLASFMPIVSAISGNVGLQSSTIVVRGLATGHITLTEWWRPLLREFKVDLLMGMISAIGLGMIATIWADKWQFGVVVGIALFAAMMTAGIMGTCIPLVSKRLGFDPAITSGPFATAFQDVVGFGIFLSLATVLLHWIE